MSRVEGEFLMLALEIGLAETIAETIRDIDRAIAEFPASRGTRYLQRLHDQRESLRNPTLRTSAALVVSMCAKDPVLTAKIRRAFRNLVDRHAELAWFYDQLPAEEEAIRRAG